MHHICTAFKLWLHKGLQSFCILCISKLDIICNISALKYLIKRLDLCIYFVELCTYMIPSVSNNGKTNYVLCYCFDWETVYGRNYILYLVNVNCSDTQWYIQNEQWHNYFKLNETIHIIWLEMVSLWSSLGSNR